jgi:hypothetical protein
MPCSTETEAASSRPDSKQLFDNREEAWSRRIRDYLKDAERMGHSLRLSILTVWGRKAMESSQGAAVLQI